VAYKLRTDFPRASGLGSGDDLAQEEGEWRDSTTVYADVAPERERSSPPGSGKPRYTRHTGPLPPDPTQLAPLPSLEGLQIVPDSLPKRDVFINQVHTPRGTLRRAVLCIFVAVPSLVHLS
jgi:hypothetical protein